MIFFCKYCLLTFHFIYYVSKHTVHNNGGIPKNVGFHDISSIQEKHELFCEIVLLLPLPFHYSNLSELEPKMGQSA